MRRKIGLVVATALLLVMALTLAGGTGTALAHVHPFVPADECALGGGAGNTSDPANDENPGQGGNGQDFIPGLIPTDNPGNANLGNIGAGNGPATGNCANG